MNGRLMLANNAIMAILLAQTWPHKGAMAVLVALQLSHFLLSKVVHPWFARRGDRPAGALLHAAHNTLALAKAHVAGWSLAGCFVAVYPVFAAAAHQDHESRWKTAWTLAAFAVVGALGGAPAAIIAPVLLLAVVLYGVWEVRAGLVREALSALRSERAELEAAQKQLVEQEKMSSLGMLAAGVAHEINNPMSYVTSNVRQLAHDLPLLGKDPELAKEYAEEVLPAAIGGIERVMTIVADLRRFAQRDPEHMELFDLNEQVAAAVRIAQSRINHGCTTELSLGELPPVAGRRQELERVVRNLVANAAEAMTGSGVVRVTTRVQDGGVTLAVADTGCGMSPETLSRLFQPFFTTKPVGHGTGLGLSVVHGIVEAHGGRIEVQSEVGKGSTFTVWLPTAPAQGHATGQPIEPSAERALTPGPRPAESPGGAESRRRAEPGPKAAEREPIAGGEALATSAAQDPAHHRRITTRLLLGGSILQGLVLWQTRDDPRAMVLLLALALGRVVISKVAQPWLQRHSARSSGWLLTAAHTTLSLTMAHVAHWSVPACFLSIYSVFASASHRDRDSRWKAAAILGAFIFIAALEGVPGSTIGTCSGYVLALYAIWEVRTGLLRGTLEALRNERAKLESAQKQLVEQEKMSSLGMVAARVAHEISNPVRLISSSVRRIAQDLSALGGDPHLAREYSDGVLPATLDGIARVNTIVADLRRFARCDPERMVEFDLNREVFGAVRIAREKVSPGCAPELVLGEVPTITGRPQEIARVVMNLLVNAAQATNGSGVVRVTTRPEGEGVAMAVADTGCGMSPETLSRLFQPFFTTKPAGEGAGLGLAVVHGIVEAHRGRIEVQSEVGKGSTFTVWLPREPAAAERRRGMSR